MNAVSIPIVVAISLFAAGMGLFGLISPSGLAAFVTRWRSIPGLWTAAIVRLMFGIALWLVAPSSRTPLVLQVLGIVSVAAAVALPLMGFSRYASLLSWWSRGSLAFVRTWCGVAAGAGIFIVWSAIA